MSIPTIDNPEDLRRALNSDANEFNLALQVDRSDAVQILAYLDAKQEGIGVSVVASAQEYTTTQAATILGMSRVHLTRLIKQGAIRAHKVGSHYRVTAREIAAQQNMQALRENPQAQELDRLWDQMGADN